MADLTAFKLRALALLRDAHETGGHTPRSLAQALWPDSPAWAKETRRHDGKSGAKGGTMWMKGGRVLWELRTLGFAVPTGEYAWTITTAGRRALEEAGL